MEKILIIEDDELAASLMLDFLYDSGFDVDVVHTITDGLSYIKYNHYDVLLLDLNLPDFSGFDLLKEIKNKFSIPIIIISAYNDTAIKVKAFRFGASDYIVKPIVFEELEVRIWSLLGRHSEIKVEKTMFEINNQTIFFKDTALALTSIEFEILQNLIKNKNKTVSREELTKPLSSISTKRSLDHHIKNIRIKLQDNGNKPTILKTEYAVGYKLVF